MLWSRSVASFIADGADDDLAGYF